ncbi:transient receptor potential cation channel protein painless-like [Chironomus tepperi]|uniref:transient receptor potential cation channel protein painless-like n=1 Tax=Chironomus tepperi TaxID=113505 RepID=UPI00391F59D3
MSHNYDLYKAFVDNSLGRFVEILEVFETDLNFCPEKEKRTIFEIILSTPDSSNFIKKCIEHGADFYLKNESHFYPIHFVIKSECIKNLRAVESLFKLEKSGKSSPYVNVKDQKDQNCLHLLAEKLTNENEENIMNMMEILLYYGCNINFPNDDQETPFYIVVRNLPHLQNGQAIFDKIMRMTDVDFHTHRGDEIVSMVKDKYIDVIPEKEGFDMCYKEMEGLLKSGDINKFETLFSSYKACIEHHEQFLDDCYSFMEIAVQKSYINIVDLLIKEGIDFNRTSLDNETAIPPPFLAYKNANVEIFKSFLLATNNQTLCVIGSEIDLYSNNENCQKTLFHQFFADMKRTGRTKKIKSISMTRDQKKCFDLLMNDPRCNRAYLNAFDKDGKSVLYYSVGFGVDYMTLKLLEKGAFIGKLVTRIRKCLLTEFLDSCIQSNDEFHDNKGFQISVNYKFLIPTPDVCDDIRDKKYNKKNKLTEAISMNSLSPFRDVEENSYENDKKYAPEMWTLRLLTRNQDYRHFVMHPVLSSFVYLKWKKIRFSLHINLIITLLFIFTFIPFIMISRTDQQSLMYKIFYGLSFTSLFMLTCREFLQFLQSKIRYFKRHSNLVDLVVIISSFIILFRLPFTNHQYRILHTVIILLETWEYFNLLGYIPLLSVSLHTKMFRKVFITFIKSLSFYSVMIIGFALAFYTLHGDKALTMKEQGMNIKNQSSVDLASLNTFASIRLSVVKSFVMMIGELDASSIYLEGYSYIGLFMLFLFIVTIVLYNLLNALAVSDTQEIRSDAKLIDLCQRIQAMYRHEKNAFWVTPTLSGFMQHVTLLFPETISNGIIFLKPNKDRDTYTTSDCKTPIRNEWLPDILCYFGKHMRMDTEIIQDMCTLLVKKREEQNEKIDENCKEKRSEKMAYDIIKINEQLVDQKKLMNEIEGLKELIRKQFDEKRSKDDVVNLLDC